MKVKVLVCGGRDFKDYDALSDWLINLLSDYDPNDITIISGHANGADKLAERFANANNCSLIIFPADWKGYGRAAGHIRNQQMLDEGKPDLVIAFPGGKGTKNMIERSVKDKVLTIKISDDLLTYEWLN